MQSIPIAPAPNTSARPGRHGWRPPTACAWRIARAQIDAGSASTPSPPSASGTATTCSASTTASSAAKPCSRVMPCSL